MTIRRRAHAFSDVDEDAILRLLSPSNRDVAHNASVRPVHPALTDFGPQTLGPFIRREYNSALTGGTLGPSTPERNIGKGKACAQSFLSEVPDQDAFLSPIEQDTAPFRSEDWLNEMHARHHHADESVRPSRVSLAPNALHHLRGLPDSPPAVASGSLPPPGMGVGGPPKTPPRKMRRTPRKKFSPTRDDNEDDTNDPFMDLTGSGSSTRRRMRQSISTRRTGHSPRVIPSSAWARRRGNSIVTNTSIDADTILSDDSVDSPGNSPPRSAPKLPSDLISRVVAASQPDAAAMKYRNQNAGSVAEFNYGDLIPTNMPNVVARERERTSAPVRSPRNRRHGSHRRPTGSTSLFSSIGSRLGLLGGSPDSDPSDSDSDDSSVSGDDVGHDFTPSSNPADFFIANEPLSKVFRSNGPRISANEPPHCPLPNRPNYQNPPLPSDVWIAVTEYLSLEDIHNLRLVDRTMAAEISPIQFRNFVAPLGPAMQLLGAHPSQSVLAKYGSHVYRFGISFEFDPVALAYARSKVSMQTQQAWYGSYEWPASHYPRYEELKRLEDLVDNNNPMLKHVLSQMGATCELALSVDSGHGWLEGPDISDMALFNARQRGCSKVFGQIFGNEHLWQAYGRDEYFVWAQKNSINETLKLFAGSGVAEAGKVIEILSNMQVRERNSFQDVTSQPDFDPDSHTGGNANPAAGTAQTGAQPPAPPTHPNGAQPAAPVPGHPVTAFQVQNNLMQLGQMYGTTQNHVNGVPLLYGNPLQSRSRGSRYSPTTPKKSKKKNRPAPKIPLQWPVIFNGYSLAAETGGSHAVIQSHIANPQYHPLLPGSLTESQAQWLMETFWAQRSFLSAYTNAVIANHGALRNIWTLNIAKISSGLLPSLAQRDFWAALPNLKRLRLLVSPDWRKEHLPNSVFIQRAMLISPLTAVGKFAAFLRDFICKLEHLSHATFGWVGGGEHGVGICARNQNLLPAPIIAYARDWISDHKIKPDPRSMIKFDHLRDLTFENCWFSPCMLETFMDKSRDTSLHTLTLDSVSMLVRHDPTTVSSEAGLTTIGGSLQCEHAEEDWLYEEIPGSATWTQTLDQITPGSTILERKYQAGIIDSKKFPAPEPGFRGHVQKIVLKSCGYAKIEGMKSSDFNQAEAVLQPGLTQDAGLSSRESQLRGPAMVAPSSTFDKPAAVASRYGVTGNEWHDKPDRFMNLGPIMLSSADVAVNEDWQGLGTLTQCVHPVDKRILEQGWGMVFGWGNKLERWAAVEDGQLEGGTGRFGGTIYAKGTESL